MRFLYSTMHASLILRLRNIQNIKCLNILLPSTPTIDICNMFFIYKTALRICIYSGRSMAASSLNLNTYAEYAMRSI